MTIERRVLARYKTAFDDKLIFDWSKVISEVQGFSKALVKAEKTPASIPAAIKAADKMLHFWLWLKQCTTRYEDWFTFSRPIHAFVKKPGTEAEMLAALQGTKHFIQQALNAVAPESFTYHGFKITNPHHLEEELCRRALEGVDMLVAIFKKRGVEKALTQGLRSINLAVIGGAPNSLAFYGSVESTEDPEITLYAGTESRGILDSNGLSTFIHEFGHHLYFKYLPADARKAWDAPWDANAKPSWVKQWDAKELDVPTEYAKVNKFEDFAETFVVFMTKPEMLTPTSKYRMQQALSLAGLYGKPVMKLAQRVLDRYLEGNQVR